MPMQLRSGRRSGATISPPPRPPVAKRYTRSLEITCCLYGKDREAKYGEGYFFCEPCRRWDNLLPDESKNKKRNSRSNCCEANHTDPSHPTDKVKVIYISRGRKEMTDAEIEVSEQEREQKRQQIITRLAQSPPPKPTEDLDEDDDSCRDDDDASCWGQDDIGGITQPSSVTSEDVTINQHIYSPLINNNTTAFCSPVITALRNNGSEPHHTGESSDALSSDDPPDNNYNKDRTGESSDASSINDPPDNACNKDRTGESSDSSSSDDPPDNEWNKDHNQTITTRVSPSSTTTGNLHQEALQDSVQLIHGLKRKLLVLEEENKKQ